LALPERWEAIDVDEEGVEALIDALEMLDTEWAQSLTEMFSSEEILEYLKFWARDTEPAGIGFATVNVMQQSLSYKVDAGTLAEQSAYLYESMGLEFLGMEQNLEINGLDAARIEIRAEAGLFVVRDYQYFFVQGREAWAVTFAVGDTSWSEYEPIFVEIVETFAVYGEED